MNKCNYKTQDYSTQPIEKLNEYSVTLQILLGSHPAARLLLLDASRALFIAKYEWHSNTNALINQARQIIIK